MAQLTHEQLWHVCQRKAGDYEPYGKHNRLTATRPALILGDCSGCSPPELKPLEDRAALVEVWWLSPGPSRASDQFPLGNRANPPFGFPR